jgi:hypothetical protein
MSDTRRRRKSQQSGGSDDLSESYDELNATKETQVSDLLLVCPLMHFTPTVATIEYLFLFVELLGHRCVYFYFKARASLSPHSTLADYSYHFCMAHTTDWLSYGIFILAIGSWTLVHQGDMHPSRIYRF